mmetsp:Transcript_49788/g.138301  ORF Transcript_49788/g.138301 Transcript_49788/m.138301 type:complete len:280 (-) Transcript_49788:44-883(-)
MSLAKEEPPPSARDGAPKAALAQCRRHPQAATQANYGDWRPAQSSTCRARARRAPARALGTPKRDAARFGAARGASTPSPRCSRHRGLPRALLGRVRFAGCLRGSLSFGRGGSGLGLPSEALRAAEVREAPLPRSGRRSRGLGGRRRRDHALEGGEVLDAVDLATPSELHSSLSGAARDEEPLRLLLGGRARVRGPGWGPRRPRRRPRHVARRGHGTIGVLPRLEAAEGGGAAAPRGLEAHSGNGLGLAARHALRRAVHGAGWGGAGGCGGKMYREALP